MLFSPLGLVPLPCDEHQLFLLSVSIQLLLVTVSYILTWEISPSLTPQLSSRRTVSKKLALSIRLYMVTASGTGTQPKMDQWQSGPRLLFIWWKTLSNWTLMKNVELGLLRPSCYHGVKIKQTQRKWSWGKRKNLVQANSVSLSRMCNLRPTGCVRLRMAVLQPNAKL